MELRLITASFFRAFPKAEPSSTEGMSVEDMEALMFFLISPKGKRCLLKVR
jgi:hypothetical protein